MSVTKKVGAVLGLAALLLWVPAQAQAQGAVGAAGGIAVPAGSFADVQDAGPAFGAGIGWQVEDRITLGFDAGIDLLSGADTDVATAPASTAPDLTVWNFNGNFMVEITEPGANMWDVSAGVGLGASLFDSSFDDPITNPETDETMESLSDLYFNTHADLRFGYQASERVKLFVGGRAYLYFPGNNFLVFNAFNPPDDQPDYDTMWAFPVIAGFSVSY